MSREERERYNQANREINEAGPLTFRLTLDQSIIVLAMVQLALRHPAIPQGARSVAIDFCDSLIAKLPPTVAAIASDGFDVRKDIPME